MENLNKLLTAITICALIISIIALFTPTINEGDIGPIGLQGIQGEQGPQGERGLPGINGTDGETGPQGPRGYTGSVGPRGAKGDDCITGELPTIEITDNYLNKDYYGDGIYQVYFHLNFTVDDTDIELTSINVYYKYNNTYKPRLDEWKLIRHYIGNGEYSVSLKLSLKINTYVEWCIEVTDGPSLVYKFDTSTYFSSPT